MPSRAKVRRGCDSYGHKTTPVKFVTPGGDTGRHGPRTAGRAHGPDGLWEGGAVFALAGGVRRPIARLPGPPPRPLGGEERGSAQLRRAGLRPGFGATPEGGRRGSARG